jgi:hypothetical protein
MGTNNFQGLYYFVCVLAGISALFVPNAAQNIRALE